MKKVLPRFYILLSITFIIWLIYIESTVKITIDSGNKTIAAIDISTPGVKGIYTKDSSEISKIIKNINSIRYYKSDNLEIYNQSPDARVVLFDTDGHIIDKIQYYGDVVVYNHNKYKTLPFTYKRLENLCNKINKE